MGKNIEINNSIKSQKRSTLKEILRLVDMSKDMKIQNFSRQINSKPEENYIIINKLGKGSFSSV